VCVCVCVCVCVFDTAPDEINCIQAALLCALFVTSIVCVCVCVCMCVVRRIMTSSVDVSRSGEGLRLLYDCHTFLGTLWQTERRLGLLCSS